jgi:hypothetical protein
MAPPPTPLFPLENNEISMGDVTIHSEYCVIIIECKLKTFKWLSLP